MNNYKFLICPFISLIICQIIKFTCESIRDRKLYFGRLFNGAGGMPSSHTTFSSSITMLIGFELGFDSPLFALSLVFALIIAYDSMGLRYESGKQAEAINIIFDELFKKNSYKKLKEKLGHKPLEVFVGLILGTLISYIIHVYY